jgi:hypothetical protein
MTHNLQISEFQLSDMVKDPAIVLIGKRGCGKSWVIKAILNHLKNYQTAQIICPTERLNHFYKKFIPDSFIYNGYTSKIFEKLLARQIELAEKQSEYEKKGKIIDIKTIMVMDDCLASKGSWASDEPISEVLFNGRHYQITYILTMQYLLGIKPDLRNNFDYIFLFRDDVNSTIKKLYEHYAGSFPSLASFKKVFNELTKDNGCLVIANRGPNVTLQEKIFHYRAPNLNNEIFILGGKQYNIFNDKNYNCNWSKNGKFNLGAYVDNNKRDNSYSVQVVNKIIDDEEDDKNKYKRKKNY